MLSRHVIFGMSFGLIILSACGGGSANDQYFRSDIPYEDSDTVEAALSEEETFNRYGIGEASRISDVVVPFTEQNGVKFVDVEINGAIGVRMIIDTGASNTLISLAEAQYLVNKGVLAKSDILGQAESRIADGSITLNTVVRLHYIIIGDKIVCDDVIATVNDNMDAALLLGNEVLNRIGAYTVNNEDRTIIFHNVPIY